MDQEERRGFVLALLLTLLLTRALRAFLSTLYYQSLSTFRLNESAYWVLALLVVALAPLLPRRATWALVLAAGASTSALPFLRFEAPYVPVAALASVSCLAALLRTRSLAGAAAGLAVEGGLLVLGRSHDPLPALGVVAIAAGALWAAWRPSEASPRGGSWIAGAGAAGLLAVELAYLGNPFAVGRWVAAPAWLVALAGGLGLVLGATRIRSAGAWTWALAGVALLDLALVRSPLVLLSFALVQAWLGGAAARLAPGAASTGGAMLFAPTLVGLLFVLTYYAGQLALDEWSHLVPLLVLLASLPAILQPRLPRARRMLAAAPAAALLGLLAISVAATAPMVAPREGDIVVVSWNVHQAFGNRGALDPEIYAKILREADADIVLLQEADTARLSSGGVDIVQYLAGELGMRAAYGRSGSAVLSRYPFGNEAQPTEVSWSLEAGLDVRGETLWVHSVHLARGRDLAGREAQVRELLDEPTKGPHLVAGDFNTCPTTDCFGFARQNGSAAAQPSPIYQALTARYSDAWVATGHGVDDPAGYTHGGAEPRRRIDLVLTEEVEVLEMRVLLSDASRLASDHHPVLARIRLPAT